MAESDWSFLRDVYAAWARGDFSDSSWADPDIEFVAVDGPTRGHWRGREAMAGSWREVLESWEDLRASPEEFRELDDGRILVLTQNSGRGKASGFDLEKLSTRGANVFTVRDGRATNLVTYWNRDRAFEDLGISRD